MIPRPIYRRHMPTAQNPSLFGSASVDISRVHLPPYPQPDLSGGLADMRSLANGLFDARAAAAVMADAGDVLNNPMLLLETKPYDTPIQILTPRCLGAMAYLDYFPSDKDTGSKLREAISQAIMTAVPGWCGTFGPGVTGAISASDEPPEGNYDITQMKLLPLAYCFYDDLAPPAAERLVTTLLARGSIQRPGDDLTFTSGVAPNDWSRAGVLSPVGVHVDIPETENHVLMIGTARYLTNQLLYQRTQDESLDNRRNGNPNDSRPSCMEQLLNLLRNYLSNDFAEYNAKPYQEETRDALLNLCTFAYDVEVRLAAQMVLDYISAHILVSSNDLRRMVPFRRRNEDKYVAQLVDQPGVMGVPLLDGPGADPITTQFALLAGNTRAYRTYSSWSIGRGFAAELVQGALSSYRLPPSIHDLFINDLHRRYFQRIHRRTMLEEPGQQRNCENKEIYCGSPSYLITAGGKPATYVIPGFLGFGFKANNLGVAVTTSFIPTGNGAGAIVNPADPAEMIQISRFSDDPENGADHLGGSENYGVAPDFLCGFKYYFPAWTVIPKDSDGLFFVNKRAVDSIELAGFYLAVFKSGDFVVIEAFDAWWHPEVSIDDFRAHVQAHNPDVQFASGKEMTYTTYFGNRIHYVIWNNGEFDGHRIGSKILSIDYGNGNPADTLAAAGNDNDQSKFLNGTALESTSEFAMVIRNATLKTELVLDWNDASQLVRIAENGEVRRGGRNAAGEHFEVWVDFAWTGPTEGDFFRPFNSLASAVKGVADGGVIKIVPGSTREKWPGRSGKRVAIAAPLGEVVIGAIS
jgi:hypothetical protein